MIRQTLSKDLRIPLQKIRTLAEISKPWREVERHYLDCIRLFMIAATIQLITEVLFSWWLFYGFLQVIVITIPWATEVYQLTFYFLC